MRKGTLSLSDLNVLQFHANCELRSGGDDDDMAFWQRIRDFATHKIAKHPDNPEVER